MNKFYTYPGLIGLDNKPIPGRLEGTETRNGVQWLSVKFGVFRLKRPANDFAPFEDKE